MRHGSKERIAATTRFRVSPFRSLPAGKPPSCSTLLPKAPSFRTGLGRTITQAQRLVADQKRRLWHPHLVPSIKTEWPEPERRMNRLGTCPPPISSARQHKEQRMLQFLSKREKKRVHFLHIGKTGGSAIKSALKSIPETPQYSITLHGHDTSLEDIPKGDYVIFFLREPIARFVSGFYSRQRKGQPRYYSEWSPNEKEAFEHFSTPNEVAASLANKQAAAVMAMKSVRHFCHYSNWYVSFDYFESRIDDILFVGFQESLDSDFAKLKSILGIPSKINLPSDDMAAHKNPRNVDKSIDARGIAALSEWYSEDAKFIELCKEIMSCKPMYSDNKKRRAILDLLFPASYFRRWAPRKTAVRGNLRG